MNLIVPFTRHAEIQPHSQQQRQDIRHRLCPDQSCFVKDRPKDEHRRNVDQPLTGDIDDQGFHRRAAGLQRIGQHIPLKMDIIKVFGDNLKKYRTAMGISQEAFAEKCGMHRTYISAIECYRRSISLENIQRIADALGIETYKLFLEG